MRQCARTCVALKDTRPFSLETVADTDRKGPAFLPAPAEVSVASAYRREPLSISGYILQPTLRRSWNDRMAAVIKRVRRPWYGCAASAVISQKSKKTGIIPEQRIQENERAREQCRNERKISLYQRPGSNETTAGGRRSTALGKA